MWDGFTLPGYDAHVYVAMAEEPRVFTVGPWGYRILLPELIGTFFPPRLIVPAFDWAARASLIAASGLLLIYLRIRGATLRACLLAVTAMMLTPSVDRVFANPFLVEPFALALLLLCLIAIEGQANAWIVALSLVVLSLSKEIWLLLLPLIFIRSLDDGPKDAALRTLRIAAPAAWVGAFMRWVWWPQAGVTRAPGDYMAALGSIASSVALWAPEFLLGGFMIAGLIALYREEAREYLAEHSLTLLPLLALPLFAAAYTGDGATDNFFADDVTRLLIYVIPFVAAMAVHLDPEHERPLVLSTSRRVDRGAMALVLAFLLAPRALDSYSRIDLSTSRDGPYLLGFTRETLKTARKLGRGETVTLDPEERKFAWGVSPPNELPRLRFFLGRGFGPIAHYGIHEIKMREPSARLIVPLLEKRALKLALTMDARTSTWITLLAGGSQIGEVLVGPQALQATFEIPATRLIRGDNQIELRCDRLEAALPRILGLQLSQPLAAP